MFRKILLPFSILYTIVLRVRHFLYDNNIIKSKKFDIPVIAIGNLSLGGTGKTPHTIYIAQLLKKSFKVGVLSRGYGRTSKGYFEVLENSKTEICGDEPVLIKNNLQSTLVAVCEKRVAGIEKMLQSSNKLEVIILDDALQHRALQPGFKILLIDYSSLNDSQILLPAGNLRDVWSRRRNAEIVVITKCPESMDIISIKKKLHLNENQNIFFSSYNYKTLNSINNERKEPLSFLKEKNITLITGLAAPNQLVNYLNNIAKIVNHISFPDHHNYSVTDIEKLRKEFSTQNADSVIVTTEKDAVKLKELLIEKEKNDWFYIKIEVAIDNSVLFEKLILEYVSKD